LSGMKTSPAVQFEAMASAHEKSTGIDLMYRSRKSHAKMKVHVEGSSAFPKACQRHPSDES
jgi:hypothetical protein